MITFSNDFKWLIRIAVGLALGLYIFYITQPIVADKLGVYRTENMQKRDEINRLKTQLNNTRLSNGAFIIHNAKLKKEIAELEKRDREQQKLVIIKPAIPVFEKTDGGISNELISRLEQRMRAPAFIQLYSEFNLNSCSDSAKNAIFSWLQFVLLYGELKTEFIKRDAVDFRNKLFSHADLMQDVSDGKGFLFWPVINQLVIYHDKIKNKNNWEEDFELISAQNYSLGQLVNRFYEQGYLPSDDDCFKQPLKMSVTGEMRNGWYGNQVTLDEWFYSFWLRRYNEKTVDVTYMALKMMQMLATNVQDNKLENLVLLSPGGDKAAEYKADFQTENIYAKVVYGILSEQGRKITIPLGREIKADFIKKLYPLHKKSNDRAYHYDRQKQNSHMAGGTSTYQLTYSRDTGFNDAAQLVSLKPLSSMSGFYNKQPVEASEKSDVLAVIKDKYGELWNGGATAQNEKYCNNKPSTSVKKMTNGSANVYIVNTTCSNWSGESLDGYYYNAVLKSSNEGIKITWDSRGIGNITVLSDRYVADLDNDGNIELIMNSSYGVGSVDQLVELSQKNIFLIKSLVEYEEGESVIYSEANKNSIIFSRGVKYKN